MSYQCPQNVLGIREPPPPVRRKVNGPRGPPRNNIVRPPAAKLPEVNEDEGKREIEEEEDVSRSFGYPQEVGEPTRKRKKFVRNSYFSDDEDVVESD